MNKKNFIKIFILLLLCLISIVGKANSPHVSKGKRTVLSAKLFNPNNYPGNTQMKVNHLNGNQEVLQQVHKTINPPQIAYITVHNFDACVKCLNFFSGYNDQRYNLCNKVLLFPFHAFW